MSSESFNNVLSSDSAVNNTETNNDIIETNFVFKGGTPIEETEETSIIKQEEKITPIEQDKEITSVEKEVEKEEEKEFTFKGGTPIEDTITNLDKLEYGWDKNQMVIGNLLTLGSNSIEALFDPDRNLKEVAVKNEAQRIKEFKKEHWKMLDGKNDGTYTMIGEAASFLLDPYYLTGYTVGSPLLLTPGSSAILNGVLIGGDSLIEQLAKTGTVDAKQLGISAATGAAIGAVLPIGGKAVQKMFPNLTKGTADKVAKYLDNKVAKVNGLSSSEKVIVQNAAKNPTVKNLTKQMDEVVFESGFKPAGSNIAAPINQAARKLADLKSKLTKDAKAINVTRRNILKPIKGLTLKSVGSKTYYNNVIKPVKESAIKEGKKILDIRNQIKTAKEIYEKQSEQLIKRQYERANKYYKLEGERTAAILKALEKNQGIGTKFLKAVLVNITRPIMGAATGAAANVGAGAMGFDVEDDFAYWAATGAALGFMQKSIQKSIKNPLQKSKYNDVIENHAVQYTFQKLRELTAGTLATKLNSFGGTTQKISRLMFRQIDDPIADKSVIAQAEAMNTYFLRKANDLIKNHTTEQKIQAVSINRGNELLRKTASKDVINLANNLKSWMDEFKVLYNKAGFYSPKDLENYFPRVLNWDAINADRVAAEKVFTNIFKNNYKMSTSKAKETAINYLQKNEGPGYSSVINQNAWNRIIAGADKGVSRKGDDLIFTPISDHITKHRSLQGKFNIVEDVLEKNNFLINDLSVILPKIVQDSTKSIAFARTFGKGGQLLRPMLQEIKQKYDDLALKNNKLGFKTTRLDAAKHETNLVLDSVDAYFDRLHKGWSQGRRFSSSVGILTMLSNLNMLGRVTISSLGDLIQPFQNSQSWTAAVKGLGRTNLFKATWEKGLARNLNYDITNEMSRSLSRTAAANEKELLLSQSWMGKWGAKDLGKNAKSPEFYNNIAFKGLGLEWLTGYARRFAYNAGASDAYNLSRQYFKVVNGAKGANSQAAKTIERDLLLTYNIRNKQALLIGQKNKFNDTIKNETVKKLLNKAGLRASNRDALIPQVDNRLLFTQSKEPMIRMLGQFLSWAMAKSSQTNRMIARIESGNTRTLIKTLAAIPVFAGIQQLREYAKHGDVITDAEYNGGELIAKSWQLSGMPGWLSDLVFNRFVGPGSRDNPFFVFAPALNLLTEAGSALSDLFKGKPDAAFEKIDKKLLPLPNWRKWVQKHWFPSSTNVGIGSGTVKPGFAYGGIIERQKFNKGDVAIGGMGNTSAILEIKKELNTPIKVTDKRKLNNEVPNQKEIKENKEMNVKDTVKAAVVAGALTTGVNAEVNKAQDNFILPKEKPKVEVVQKEKTKDYSKLPALAEDKKKFLMDSASVIYQNNKGRDVPDDILLAIALEETGYGTSRFYREGNNYFNMVAEKGDDRIKAKGDNTQVAKFKQPSESLDKFYSWVDNKPHYKNVRATIEKYKAGEATKSDIIDEIAKTGWAENPNWSKNVKSILKARVNGKHSEELNNLKTSLFEEKE